MKQGKIIYVSNILDEIAKESKPSDIALAFFNIRRMIKPQVEFQIEQQGVIAEKYPFKFDENGKMVFADEESEKNFNKEMTELSNLDIDITIDKVKIKMDGRFNISEAVMEALSDFIEYE